MIRLFLVLTAFGTTLTAQWLNYPAAGIPRLPDGKPNLSAPAPRSPDGKPDSSGLWESDEMRQGPFDKPPAIAIKPEDVILTPEGDAPKTWVSTPRFSTAKPFQWKYSDVRKRIPAW